MNRPCVADRAGHCAHYTGSKHFTGPDVKWETVESELCCFCGAWRSTRVEYGEDPAHGPFARNLAAVVKFRDVGEWR